MDYAVARTMMVENQIRTNKVTDLRVIDAFERLPRELFVPDGKRGIAYVDEDIPIAEGRWLMEPMVLARLLQAAAIQPSDMALDIGCGSGYATAILARLAGTVVALESLEPLVQRANETIEALGIDNVVVLRGELMRGCPKQAPYDVILIDGAVAEITDDITGQLADGGRLVTVQQEESGVGRAVLMQRYGEAISRRVLFDAATPVLPEFARQPKFVF